MILNLRVITLGTDETHVELSLHPGQVPMGPDANQLRLRQWAPLSLEFSSVREATWTLTGAQLHCRIRERYVWHARTNPIEANLKF